MFCLIYQFDVKPEMEQTFREGWHALTQKLTETNGSLGARLHQSNDGLWISYAQWPDEETWLRGERVIHNWLQTTDWSKCLKGEVKLLMQMTMTDDLLKQVARIAT